MAFRDLVLRIRFERAVELLRETDTPITGIATALGYSSPANFTRAFRQAQGRTPSQVRNNGLIPG
jgi:AraC-like DNA-binding protein